MMKHHVLLTGATGFVGKVVLFDLLRRREELGIAGITVLIREKKSRDGSQQTPAERFKSGVAQAEIFRTLSAGWRDYVRVVKTELEQSDLGLPAADARVIEESVTHVLHCAASVEFDLPIAAALTANVDAALNVLELARRCSRLVGMVSVSTAYVSVWRDGPIFETLAHLPRPATEIRRSIVEGTRSEAVLLAESGHPNTYTYTKCLAEHLLSERRGSVPLMIVRPSIISAAWAEPKPGWIDSNAAFAGCLLYTGLGLVKTWEADPNVRLDVVPVDVVSQRVIDAAFSADMPKVGQPVPIRFAAMGLTQAMRADMSTQATCRFFEERPGAKAAPGTFIGGVQHGFLYQDLLRRVLPVQALRAYFAMTGNKGQRRQIEKMDERVQRLNAAFRYFIHHSFDFRPSTPVALPGFTPVKYIDIVNRACTGTCCGETRPS